MSFTQNAYYGQKFARLALSGEILAAKTFEECEFQQCSFINCKFKQCRFLTCEFHECSLSAVMPIDCRFNGVKFFRSKVIGLDWTKTQAVRDLEFKECQVDYSNFKLMSLAKLKMIDCQARETDFTEADLSGGDFKKTDFEKAVFFKANLSGADFQGARNYFIDARSTILKKTRFSLPEALVLLKSLDIILD